MKAQSMAPTTVVLLIIAVIVIAVSAIFVFSSGGVGMNKTNQNTQIASGGQQNASAKIDQLLAEQDCNPKCFKAQQQAKGYNKSSDYCPANVGNVQFCTPHNVGGVVMNCAQVFKNKDAPEDCLLTFDFDGDPPHPTAVLRCNPSQGAGSAEC
jgi:uncharacterized membrane protein